MPPLYTVVTFSKTDSVAIVRADWVIRNENQTLCRYPPDKSSDLQKISATLKAETESVSASWPIHAVEIYKDNLDSFRDALRYQTKAENYDDPNTTDPEKMGKGYRTKKPALHSSDEESSPPRKKPKVVRPKKKQILSETYSQSLLALKAMEWPTGSSQHKHSDGSKRNTERIPSPIPVMDRSSNVRMQGFATSTQQHPKPISRSPLGEVFPANTSKHNKSSLLQSLGTKTAYQKRSPESQSGSLKENPRKKSENGQNLPPSSQLSRHNGSNNKASSGHRNLSEKVSDKKQSPQGHSHASKDTLPIRKPESMSRKTSKETTSPENRSESSKETSLRRKAETSRKNHLSSNQLSRHNDSKHKASSGHRTFSQKTTSTESRNSHAHSSIAVPNIIQNQILQRLTKIEDKVDDLIRLGNRTMKKVDYVSTSTDCNSTTLDDLTRKLSEIIIQEYNCRRDDLSRRLPAYSEDGINDLDSDLKDSRVRLSLVQLLSHQNSKKSLTMTVRKHMALIMTDELASKYSLKGFKTHKIPFIKKKTLCSVLCDAARLQYPDALDEEVTEAISLWLTKASSRLNLRDSGTTGPDTDHEDADYEMRSVDGDYESGRRDVHDNFENSAQNPDGGNEGHYRDVEDVCAGGSQGMDASHEKNNLDGPRGEPGVDSDHRHDLDEAESISGDSNNGYEGEGIVNGELNRSADTDATDFSS